MKTRGISCLSEMVFSSCIASSCQHDKYIISCRYSPAEIRTFMIVPSIWLGIFLCMCGICICRRRKRRNRYQSLTSRAHGSNLEKNAVHRSTNNENPILYTIPLPRPTVDGLEEPPPNYENLVSYAEEQEGRNLIHF